MTSDAERPNVLLEASIRAVMLSTWVVVSATMLACCVPLAIVSMLPDHRD